MKTNSENCIKLIRCIFSRCLSSFTLFSLISLINTSLLMGAAIFFAIKV